MPRPKNIRVVKKISKIVLGLEAEPHQGTTHYWGLPYLLVTSGAHSNKQTNKTTMIIIYIAMTLLELLLLYVIKGSSRLKWCGLYILQTGA